MKNIVFNTNNGTNSEKDANDLRINNEFQEWYEE